jgi:hypothetical protein
LLQGVLEPLLKDSFDTIRDVESTGQVAFKDLALISVPATLVLEKKTDSVGMVRSCHLIRPPNKPAFWQIGVDVVDWDGRRCGLLAQLGHMYEYQGLLALTALEVSTFDGLPSQQSIRQRLIARGRKWEELRGHFFEAFSDQHEERVNERMVIDARAYHKYETEFPNYAKLSEIGQLTWAQSMNRYSPTVPSAPGSPIQVDLTPMSDDQCFLTVHYVKCFNIEKKKWEKLDVTKIYEIPWAERAFDSLVLEQSEKDLVLALVDRDQFKQDKPFDDFIGGKGQGRIMLFCGLPGVGKTLTAEIVSEHLRRALFKLGAAARRRWQADRDRLAAQIAAGERTEEGRLIYLISSESLLKHAKHLSELKDRVVMPHAVWRAYKEALAGRKEYAARYALESLGEHADQDGHVAFIAVLEETAKYVKAVAEV